MKNYRFQRKKKRVLSFIYTGNIISKLVSSIGDKDGDDSKGIYTLRLAKWTRIPQNGNYSGSYDLIVTAQQIGNNTNIKVINWSTNENKNKLKIAGVDATELMDIEATPEHYKDTYVHNFVGSYKYTPSVINKKR